MSHWRRAAESWAVQIATLALLAIVIVFYGLGSNSLHDYDESRHAMVAKKMADDGDWLTPREADGKTYFHKAPLKLWMTALLFEVAGANEFTIRFWSAVFAVGTVLVIALLGAPLIGRRAALLAALVLLANTQFLYGHSAKTGEMDTALLFFLSAGLLLLPRGVDSRRVFLAACACIGMCGMVKHASYVPLAMGIGGTYLVVSGTWRKVGLTTTLLGLLAIAVVVVPWHLYQWLAHGEQFTGVYFGDQLIRRIEGDLFAGGHRPGSAYYVPVLFHGLFPWAVLAMAALARGVYRTATDRTRVELLLLAWLVLPFAAITITVNKFSWYLLPCYPAIALLLGSYLAALFDQPRARWLQGSFVVGAVAALSFASTAGASNPFALRAADGLIEAHPRAWLASAWSAQPAVLLVAGLLITAALAVLWDRTLRRPGAERPTHAVRAIAVAALLGIALHSAVAPLRHAGHETCVDRLIARAADSDDFLILGERADAGIFYAWERVGPSEVLWGGMRLLEDALRGRDPGPHLQLIMPTRTVRYWAYELRGRGQFGVADTCGDFALLVPLSTGGHPHGLDRPVGGSARREVGPPAP